MAKKDHEVMTTTEVMKFLRISYATTITLLNKEIIPSIVINDRGDRRVLREEVINFVRGGKKPEEFINLNSQIKNFNSEALLEVTKLIKQMVEILQTLVSELEGVK